MAIWMPELPDIPIQQWYHRIPHNNDNWAGWPNKTNPYVNGAFWHLTFQLILNELKPAGAASGVAWLRPEQHRRDGGRVRQGVRARQAVVAAVRQLYLGYLPSRVRFLNGQLPDAGEHPHG